jgi:hypothetical protein
MSAAGQLQVHEVPRSCKPVVLSGFTDAFNNLPVQGVVDQIIKPGNDNCDAAAEPNQTMLGSAIRVCCRIKPKTGTTVRF